MLVMMCTKYANMSVSGGIRSRNIAMSPQIQETKTWEEADRIKPLPTLHKMSVEIVRNKGPLCLGLK